MGKAAAPNSNVERFMARTETLRAASEHVKDLRNLDILTKWTQSGEKQILASRLNREKKIGTEEIRLLGVELKTRRRQKLKEFYAAQDVAYDKELNEMGMAMVKARV